MHVSIGFLLVYFGTLICAHNDVVQMTNLIQAKHLPLKNKSDSAIHLMWKDFKKQFNKVYTDVLQEFKSFQNFHQHIVRIETHNKLHSEGKKSYKLGLNHFSDMSHDEFKRKVGSCLLKQHPSRKTGGSTFLAPNHLNVPSSIDWRQHGYVTPVKNQGACGSCWSFSTTGALEGQYFKKNGHLVSLSEQQLVDCSQNFGNDGCNGGLMDNAFQYIKSAGGLESEESYPYIDKLGPQPQNCKFNISKVVAVDTGFVDIPQGDEQQLMYAVASQGPVSVAIDANHPNFMLYKEGIYDEPSCSSDALDHGVLVVGYGKTKKIFESQYFWIVKNSWDTTWGEQGYIRMSRNKKNQCGIATKASYPLV